MSTLKEEQEVQAFIKYVRMSPKKLRDVADHIQGKRVSTALDLLKFIPRKSARLILKALQSAVANAENNHDLSSEHLVVRRALIEEGPALRRYRPAARGMAHPFRKRTSHIRIILTPSNLKS